MATKYPLSVDQATGNVYPLLVNGLTLNLPAGTKLGGLTIGVGGFDGTFAALTSKPTTIAGYGITDFNSLGDARWSLLSHTHAFSTLTSKPTTLSGYGITDAQSISGTLALAGFSSVTGRIGNANLPLGPQLYDNAGTPVIAANFNLRKLYTSDGTEWLDFSDPDAGPVIPVSKGLKVGTFYIGGQDPSAGDSFIDPENQAATFGTVSAANRIYSGNETYYSSAATAHWSIQPWNTLYNGTNDVQLNLVFNRNIDSSRQDASDYQIRLGLEGNYNNGSHKYIEYNFDTVSPDLAHNRRWMYLKVVRDNSATPMTGDWQFWGNNFQLGAYLDSATDVSSTYFSVSYLDATSTNLVLKSIPARSSKLYLNTTDSTGNPGSYATIVLQRAGVDKWSWTNQGANGDTLSVRNGSAEVYSIAQSTGLVTLNLGLTVAGALTLPTGSVTDTMLASAVKPAVTLVAASNLTLSGGQTIDGVAGVAGQSIILATAQTTGSENGPWVMQSGAWTRPTWYTNGSTTQAPQFLTTFVRLGTTYQGSTWRMTTAGVTIGTTATTWTQTPVSLASSNVTGTLPVANGGTGITSLGAGIATWLGSPTEANLKSAQSGLAWLDTAQTWTAGIKQTFGADATNAGFRLAGVTADPSSLTAGDLWYRSDTEEWKYRGASSTRTLANLAGTQTLTNKTIDGGSNTLQNVNASSITTGWTSANAPVGVPFIASVTGVSLTTANGTDTTVFTVPAGKTFVCTNYYVVLTTVTGYSATNPPTFALVESAGGNNICAAYAGSTSFSAANKIVGLGPSSGGGFVTAAAASLVKFRVTTGTANASTTITARVDVQGFYY
jgi:hypothetical protein